MEDLITNQMIEEIDIANNLDHHLLSDQSIRLQIEKFTKKCKEYSCSIEQNPDRPNIIILKGVKNDI